MHTCTTHKTDFGVMDPLCVADKWEKLKETESVPCKMMQSCLWNSMSMNSLWAAHWDVQDVQHLLACLLHSIAWGNLTIICWYTHKATSEFAIIPDAFWSRDSSRAYGVTTPGLSTASMNRSGSKLVSLLEWSSSWTLDLVFACCKK
jgi:hypothetical protein